MYIPHTRDILTASKFIRKLINPTPLQFNLQLTYQYGANIFLKREDLTPVRSYKIRGAYNALLQRQDKSVVTCSAGNHAQGVAYSCKHLNKMGYIFMPIITPQQKIDRVKKLGGPNVTVYLEGKDFDESCDISKRFAQVNKIDFLHPFDTPQVIEGQGSVGVEVMEQLNHIDYVILPIGGGGLCSGVSSFMKQSDSCIKIIGVQSETAPSLFEAFIENKPVTLHEISTFVDGASVKRVGDYTFPIMDRFLDRLVLVSEKDVCLKMVEMYNQYGIVVEPAGVLSLCGLELIKNNIVGKNVVCIISGGNSDIRRIPEILKKCEE